MASGDPIDRAREAALHWLHDVDGVNVSAPHLCHESLTALLLRFAAGELDDCGYETRAESYRALAEKVEGGK